MDISSGWSLETNASSNSTFHVLKSCPAFLHLQPLPLSFTKKKPKSDTKRHTMGRPCDNLNVQQGRLAAATRGTLSAMGGSPNTTAWACATMGGPPATCGGVVPGVVDLCAMFNNSNSMQKAGGVPEAYIGSMFCYVVFGHAVCAVLCCVVLCCAASRCVALRCAVLFVRLCVPSAHGARARVCTETWNGMEHVHYAYRACASRSILWCALMPWPEGWTCRLSPTSSITTRQGSSRLTCIGPAARRGPAKRELCTR